MPYRPTGVPRGRPPHPGLLTPAEQRVLDLLRESLTDAEIATRLGLSQNTVHTHVSHMLSKLDLHDRRSLAAWEPPREAAPVGHRRWFAVVPAVLRKLGGSVPGPALASGVVLGVAVLATAAALAFVVVRSELDDPDETPTAVAIATGTATAGPTAATTVVVTSSPSPPATPTASASLPPIPPPITGYAKDVRTGTPVVDAVLDAIEAADLDALAGLVEFAEAPCLLEEGLEAHAGPVCRPGEAAGTIVSYFVASTCAPFAYYRPDELPAIRRTLRPFLAPGSLLYAAYDMPNGGGREAWDPGQYGLIFAAEPGGLVGTRLYVGVAGVVHANGGCSEGPGATYAREALAPGAEVILPPPAGALVWMSTLRGGGADRASAVVVAPDGAVYVAGETSGPRFEGQRVLGESDAVLARIGDFGVPEWVRVRGMTTGEGFGADTVGGMAIAPNGELVLVGSSNAPLGDGSRPRRVSTWRFDAAGELRGETLSSPVAEDSATAVAVNDDGSLYLVGSAMTADMLTSDVLVVRADADGDEVWRRTLGDVAGDTGRDIAATADGGIYVFGTVDAPGMAGGPSTTASGPDFYLAKLTAGGEVAWARKLERPGWETAGGMAVADDGSIYLAGTTGGFSDDGAPTRSALVVVKYNADGGLLWERTYDTQGDDGVSDIALAPDGALYVGGWIVEDWRLPGSGPDRLLVARFSAGGDLSWVQALPVAGSLADVSVAAATSGDVFVVASVRSGSGIDTNSDIAIFRHRGP